MHWDTGFLSMYTQSLKQEYFVTTSPPLVWWRAPSLYASPGVMVEKGLVVEAVFLLEKNDLKLAKFVHTG